jgi:hypothetical protein
MYFYRHKVKLNPGTTKKGQAVKTSLEMFNRDKETTTREKNLIKSNLSKVKKAIINRWNPARNFQKRIPTILKKNWNLNIFFV